MENIKITNPNFTVENGYFYTFDSTQDALLQKTDDGNTAFSYPCDTLLSDTILSLEYDGVSFWSLENTDPYKIKRWKIDNYICKLQETYELDFGSSHTIDTNCFTVEHYHTAVTTTVSGGETSLYIDDYHNNPIIIDSAVLHLGPNSNGDEEDVNVTGTIFGGVTIDNPIVYPYSSGDKVNFHRRLWVFNNYNGTDDSTGAIYKLDSHTGGFMDKYSGGAYKEVKACTYYRINAFTELGQIDTLMYAKGANTLFINIEEESKDYSDADTVNDTFTGTNGSSPDSSKYTNINTPTIQTNQLQLNVAGIGTEGIHSKYFVDGDFDVYVDGILGTYDSGHANSEYYQHSLGILFPNESDRYCKVSRGYSTEFGSLQFQNFSSISKLASDTVVSGVSANNGDDINEYSLRLRRAADEVHFYYRTVISGTNSEWFSLGSETMFSSDAQLTMYSTTNLDSPFTAYFDNLTFTNGQIAYVSTATEFPYYGSMVMDNVTGGVTIDYLDEMSVDRNNMYRLHDSSGTYNYELSPLESFVTSISLSASPAIIAANGLSTTDIKAWVKDQFLQPVASRRVTFSESADGSIIAGTEINTDADGYAQTVYQAGIIATDVKITAVVQQTN